jgi:hypothetical protein
VKCAGYGMVSDLHQIALNSSQLSITIAFDRRQESHSGAASFATQFTVTLTVAVCSTEPAADVAVTVTV